MIAIASFDYPPVTYDLLDRRELFFPRMIDLDHYLQGLFLGGDPNALKDGLSGILYWSRYRVPYRNYRVAKVRAEVTDAELHHANTVIRSLDGPVAVGVGLSNSFTRAIRSSMALFLVSRPSFAIGFAASDKFNTRVIRNINWPCCLKKLQSAFLWLRHRRRCP